MTDQDRIRADKQDLRARAEALRTPESARRVEEMSTMEVAVLLHELETHQIELELQNQELRNTQEELLAARDEYTELYDMAPNGYVTTGKRAAICRANLTFAWMLGVSRDDLVGQQLTTYILPEDQDVYYLHERLTHETREGDRCEFRLRTKRDDSLWVRMDSVSVESPDGQCDQIRSAISDIAARKRAVQELKEHDQHLEELVRERTAELTELSAAQQLVLDSVRAAICYKDTANNYLRVNRAAAQMMGLSPDEIQGKSADDVVPCEAAAYYQEDLKAIHSGQPNLGIVESLHAASDQQRWLLTDRVPTLDKTGTVTGITVFSIDITESKLAQEKAAHRAEELRSIVNSMAGRENRMAELKGVLGKLRAQIEQAGLTPVAGDPLMDPLDRGRGSRA